MKPLEKMVMTVATAGIIFSACDNNESVDANKASIDESRRIQAQTTKPYYPTPRRGYGDKQRPDYSEQQPPYELTQEQRDFLDKNDDVRHKMKSYRNTIVLITYRDDIIAGKMTGSPLGDIAALIHQQGIVPLDKRKELSDEFDISMEDIETALAIYGLGVIDGRPYYGPAQKGLRWLDESGLLQKIDDKWAEFSERYAGEVHEKRLAGENLTGENYAGGLLTKVLNGLVSVDEIMDAARIEGDSKAMVGLVLIYADRRLFEDVQQFIPESERLVKYKNSLSLTSK